VQALMRSAEPVLTPNKMCTSNSKNSRRAFSVFTTLTLIVAGCIPLSAQSGGNFQITNSVIAAGGGESRDVVNNRFGHQSTVGEHATGPLLQNPPYSQTAGFWASQIDLSPTASAASISGRILTSDGVPLAGASINLSGARTAQAITDGNGTYTFADLEVGGFYTVTPARANYSFNPSSRSLSLLGNMTDAVFAATASGGTLNPLDITAFLFANIISTSWAANRIRSVWRSGPMRSLPVEQTQPAFN
jgi:hypothetical protein